MIVDFIIAFLMVLITFNIWNGLALEKFKWGSIRTWVYILITCILTLINYYNTNALLKFLSMTLIFIIVYKYLFKSKLKYSIVGPLITQTLFFVSESIFAIVMFLLLKNGVSDFVNDYFGSVITNVIVSVIVIIISRFPIIKIINYKFTSNIARIDEITVIFSSILIVYVYSIFALNIYYSLNPAILMLMSIIISLMSFILILMFFKAKEDYYKINDKYNSSLESLKELENALTNHRIDNHENRNHLMTIRNMTTSKKIIKFIDTILDNKLKDDKNVSKETDIVPAGGLRGLVYSKLLLMNSKKIDYELDVASSVRIVDILDYGNETMLDICKIIGIFLDNAIEEVDTIEDKYIVIEMYLDEDIFVINITNTFDNTKNKDNIYKAGVSTKGGNHGYGLSLVKKLVHHNKKLKTYHEINENQFTQVLKIYK